VLVCEKCLNFEANSTQRIASNVRAIMNGKLVGIWKELSFFGSRNMLKFVGGGLGKHTMRCRVCDNPPEIQKPDFCRKLI
jgi:hypothetical protein